MRKARPPCCMATLLYCDCGACGPDGAGGLCCRSSDFFSESRMPPLVGGDTGVAGPAGCDGQAGLVIQVGLRALLACRDKDRLGREHPPPSTPVGRRLRLAGPPAPRDPAPPPRPRAPP